MPEEKNITILIAEDHEITRVGLKLTLKQFSDFSVVAEAEDGRSVISQAEKFKPRVILMDIGLPIMDGIEVTQKIKSKNPDIRIIMLTSHENDRDVFAALSAGADGYCLKEIAGAQLAMAIRTVAGGAAWLDPGVASRVLKASAMSLSPVASDSEQSLPKTYSLSHREIEVLQLVVDGMSNQEIAERLTLSIETVKTHMRHIMEKMAVSDRTQAAVKAMRQRLV